MSKCHTFTRKKDSRHVDQGNKKDYFREDDGDTDSVKVTHLTAAALLVHVDGNFVVLIMFIIS